MEIMASESDGLDTTSVAVNKYPSFQLKPGRQRRKPFLIGVAGGTCCGKV